MEDNLKYYDRSEGEGCLMWAAVILGAVVSFAFIAITYLVLA